MDQPPSRNALGVVVIGRNEGDRLVRCLASTAGQAARIIYVDSGSTDGSVAAAKAAGAEVVELDMTKPFTAARARNAGLEKLSTDPAIEYVQFIDGDCELQPAWIITAQVFLRGNPRAAVTAGRLRERFPEASLYNRLCDAEWNTPVGQTTSCGGIAMMRRVALVEVGGYNPALIAGEEPELCIRLRAKSWEVWRLDHEMALHDAAMTHFAQWWTRERRAGHAYSERMALHGAPPEYHGVAGVRRALIWGCMMPMAVLLGCIVCPFAPMLLLAYPIQITRLALQDKGRDRWRLAFFSVLSKFPQAQGCLQYALRRLRNGPVRLIEYK